MSSGMNMHMNLTQRQEMRPIMTKQMIMSIKMLQLPSMLLQEHIQQELIANPVLETIEENEEEEEQHPVRDDAERADSPDTDTEETPAATSDVEAEMSSNYEPVVEYDRDWSEDFGQSSPRRRNYSDGVDKKMEAIKATAAPPRSLREELEEQIQLSTESDRLKTLAMLIVGNLDPEGYLRIELDDCFLHMTDKGGIESFVDPLPTDDEKEEALFFVQTTEPAGIAARSIRECLILQLTAKAEDYRYEEQLITNHFEDLAYNRLPKIAKAMGSDIDRVKDALEVIRTLNPKPGSGFGVTPHQYIVPDVSVENVDGVYIVRIEKAGISGLRINEIYAGVYQTTERGSKEREYLKDKIQSARWLIDSIRQRHETLFKISKQIVEIQKEFLDNGIEHLKPLMMQEVADRIGMHVSTVSRALTDKYIQTPQGLYPMKFFFTGGFDNQNMDGESESNRAIMERIRKMIDEEHKPKPLSDQDIVQKLKHLGINIARRTVAKYREKMRIPSSRQRREY